MELTGRKRAQSLLTQLKGVIEEQETTILKQASQISDLKEEVEKLTKSQNLLLEKVEQLENHVSDVRSNTKKHHRKKSSSSGRNKEKNGLSNHQVTNGRVDSMEAEDRDRRSSVSVERSSSFHRKHLEEQDARLSHGNDYELSSDIRDRQVEVIRKLYGGAANCEHAARVIQEAYRNYRMRVNFQKIRHSKTRRLTIDNIPNFSFPSSPTGSGPTGTIKRNKSSEKNDVEVVELELEHSFEESNQKRFDAAHEITSEGSMPTVQSLQLTNSTKDVPEDGDVNISDDSDKVQDEDTVTPKVVASPTEGLVNNGPSPPSQEELVASILTGTPPPSLQYAPSRKKRHGYETVVLPSQLPATPEHTATPAETPSVRLRRRPNTTRFSAQSRNSDSDVTNRRSPVWHRTGSELSLTSFDNEADMESMRSSDTASITSEMSSNLADPSHSGYQRKSTLSVRSSWNNDVNNDVIRKRLYRIGLNLFNKKPSKGLSFLIDNMFVANSPPAVAAFLLNRKGLSRQMVGEYLGNTQKVFNQEVLDSVCELMDFSSLELDEALRSFQAQIKVQGEAQKVERLVESFSQRYCTCNPKLIENLQNPDSIFVLAFAIIMLNTDLHSPNMKHEKRMSEEDFVKNLRGVDNGEDLSEVLLKNIYNRIKERELVTMGDHMTQVVQVEGSIVGKKPVLSVPHRRLVCYCRLYQVSDPTKPQKLGLHQREVFLFNDMVLITKILQKKKTGNSYTFKQSFSLHGMTYLAFETTYYPFGIRLINAMDNKVLITFNAPNEHDRVKFVNDIKESIAEVNQMESLRIEAELEKAQATSPTEVRTNNFLNIDAKKMSTSMQNLNDSSFSRVMVHDQRPTSMYNLSVVNETNNNNFDVSQITSDPEKSPTRNGDPLKSPARNAPRIPVIGTFFGNSGKRNVLKRAIKLPGTRLPGQVQNGSTPAVVTSHEV